MHRCPTIRPCWFDFSDTSDSEMAHSLLFAFSSSAGLPAESQPSFRPWAADRESPSCPIPYGRLVSRSTTIRRRQLSRPKLPINPGERLASESNHWIGAYALTDIFQLRFLFLANTWAPFSLALLFFALFPLWWYFFFGGACGLFLLRSHTSTLLHEATKIHRWKDIYEVHRRDLQGYR